MNIKNLLLILSILFLLNIPCLALQENSTQQNNETELFFSNVLERENYKVQIKQYAKEYPIALYVVFKEQTPLLNDIKKILKTELLVFSKTLEDEETNVIASAWFDDQVSDNLEKIELSTRNSAFVWVGGDEKTIKTFPDYIKYLKEKILDEKEKEKLEEQVKN